MYRLDKTLLDLSPHKGESYNHIKKQYVKHLLEMIYGVGRPVWTTGGIVSDKVAESLSIDFSEMYPYKTAFLFDTIENQQDPRSYLLGIRMFCDSKTQIFITCPCRTIMSFWSYNHWHEIDPYRFKHLVEGCGFKIVQHKDKIIWRKWYQYIGFRGILRLLFGTYHLHIYELRLK